MLEVDISMASVLPTSGSWVVQNRIQLFALYFHNFLGFKQT